MNTIRTFLYTMKNPMARKCYMLRRFAPKRYAQFCEFMYTLNTEVMLGNMSEHDATDALLKY